MPNLIVSVAMDRCLACYLHKQKNGTHATSLKSHSQWTISLPFTWSFYTSRSVILTFASPDVTVTTHTRISNGTLPVHSEATCRENTAPIRFLTILPMTLTRTGAHPIVTLTIPYAGPNNIPRTGTPMGYSRRCRSACDDDCSGCSHDPVLSPSPPAVCCRAHLPRNQDCP